MENSNCANQQIDCSDDEFCNYASYIHTPFEQLDLSHGFGLDRQDSDHDQTPINNGSQSKDFKDDWRIAIPDRKSLSSRSSMPAPMINIPSNQTISPELQCNNFTPLKIKSEGSCENVAHLSHNLYNTPQTSASKYYCSACSRSYKKKNNYQSHMRKHVFFKYILIKK